MSELVGLYIKDIKDLPLLSAEEELKIARQVKRGNKNAVKKMIQSNLRLVISIAKRYANLGVPLIDLIEEGNIGLMRAVKKFDPNRGYRFSTYAAYWIRQFVTRAISEQGRTIRIPVYMNELIIRWKKVTNRLSHVLGRKPKIQEIAKEMKTTLEKVRQIKKAAKKIASLDTPIGDEGATRLLEIVEQNGTITAQDELSRFLRHEKIQEALELMDDREKEILCLRYGLKDSSSRTLRETAKEFNLTRERIRQIEQESLAKLKFVLTADKPDIRLPKRKCKIRKRVMSSK